MTDYSKHVKKTAQTEKIAGSNQVKNSAGGYVWKASDRKHFERFVIMGTEGGTYYIGEQKLTLEATNTVLKVLNSEDWKWALDFVIDVCKEGRAYKRDSSLFVFALAMSPEYVNNTVIRKYASENLAKVAETPRMLATFVYYVDQFRGWGSLLRHSVAQWYTEKNLNSLAYQLFKYRGGQKGWSNRDMLRMSHPKTNDPVRNALFRWVTKLESSHTDIPEELMDYDFVVGFQKAMSAETEKDLISYINEYKLTWEMIPTQFLKSGAVWEALLPNLPLMALLRNMRTISGLDVFKNTKNVKIVLEKLRNEELIHKSRVHPLHVLMAYRLSDNLPNSIRQALDDAFYMAFKNVEPTGKRYMLGLDVSGSMGMYTTSCGLTARDCAALMAMVTNRTEDFCQMVAFSHELVNFPIQQRATIEQVIGNMNAMSFGMTDCALPMVYALKHKIPVDMFVIYTDSETYHGNIHPVQALKEYREKMGIDAKMAVVAMTSNGFSIADPNDVGMMDFVGFDTATPQAIASFATL